MMFCSHILRWFLVALCVFGLVFEALSLAKSDGKSPSILGASNQSSASADKSEEPLQMNGSGYEVTAVHPLGPRSAVYYLKNGHLWSFTAGSGSVSAPRQVMTNLGNVISFDVTDDNRLLAYVTGPSTMDSSLIAYPAVERTSEYRGTQLIVRDLKTSVERTIYSVNGPAAYGILGAIFSPDGSNVFFSGDHIWRADLSTGRVQELDQGPNEYDYCFAIQDVSRDGLGLLVKGECSSGTEQWIVDARTGRTLGAVDNGGEGMAGPVLFGFVDNRTLVGESPNIDDPSDTRERLSLFDYTGRLSHPLLTVRVDPSVAGGFEALTYNAGPTPRLVMIPSLGQSSHQSLLALDPSTLELSDIGHDSPLLALTIDEIGKEHIRLMENWIGNKSEVNDNIDGPNVRVVNPR